MLSSAARHQTKRPNMGRLRHDAFRQSSLMRIGTDRLRGREVQIPLDVKPEGTAHGLQFGQAHIAQFREAVPEVAQAELCEAPRYVPNLR